MERTTIGNCLAAGLGLLASIAFGLSSCGGGSRQLTAISVQPANGDAVIPAGTLSFTAIGTFNQAPTTQANLVAQWSSSNSSVATIDPITGLATCVAVGGPVTITASAPGKGGTVSGSAMLDCIESKNKVGRCEVMNDTLSGACLGMRGEVCQQAYDPTDCPLGQPPISQAPFQCGPVGEVDNSRECIP